MTRAPLLERANQPLAILALPAREGAGRVGRKLLPAGVVPCTLRVDPKLAARVPVERHDSLEGYAVR
jgi:hypothetical protein